MRRRTPLAAVARGIAAGLVGTAAMTVYQAVPALRRGAGLREALIGSPAERWEDAPAPAQVGHRLVRGVLGRELDPSRSAAVGAVMHWAYGASWGALWGLLRGRAPGPAAPAGLAFGTAVWGSSYVTLPVMGIYDPPWRYPLGSLARDWSYHAVYGLGLGLGSAALERA